YIRSEGGEIAAGLDIYDEIRLYRGETRGIVMGFAQSMGAIILQACTHRVAARHAEVLIHNNTMIRQLTDRDVRRRGDPLADVRRDLLLLRHSTDDIFVRSTGRTKKEIRAQCKLGRPMTAEEALKFGLLDELI
ncbi:MAG: ATP-dependent Clp protease proteolytic subunit, partial [bacterium]|nr:ATP-dependent Clp protease proteolytic subunit [bacterium]